MDTFATSAPGLPSAIDSLVDERIGVISRVIESPYERGEPAFFHFFAETAPCDRWLVRRPFSYGGGTSTSRDIAAAKAIGECIERYCSSIYDLDTMPLSSSLAADFDHVSPEHFVLFSAEQYASRRLPYLQFGETTPARWVPARRITDGSTIHVPAASVYLPYYGERDDEVPVIPPLSTGLAAGPSFARASCSGLLEVVERDAFCRCWYGRQSPPLIDRTTLTSKIVDMIDRFEACRYNIDLLDITSDLGIPVVLAIARGAHNDGPALSVAASAALNPVVAATKALEELAMTVRYQRDLALGRYKSVNLAGDLHLGYWNQQSRRELAAFLWASSERIDMYRHAQVVGVREHDALTWLAARLAHHGYDALVCDITSSDIRATGLVVVRAIVPGLQPLLFGEGMVAHGGTRLQGGQINPHLHPFP